MADDIVYDPVRAPLERNNKRINTIFIIEGVFLVLILLNLLYLNFSFLQKPKSYESNPAISTLTNNIPILQQPADSNKVTSPTPLPPTTAPSSPPTPSPTAKPATTTSSTTQSSTIKDYFVPLGSGTTQANDWTDVVGAQTTVDFGQYQSIKSIVLEASVSVPTANQDIYVRLFNNTDKHPVWYSDVTMNGGASAYLVSSPVIYDTGSKTYQVQMKTQLGYPANLTQSRIHITIK